MSHYPEAHLSTLSNALKRMSEQRIEEVKKSNERAVFLAQESAQNEYLMEEESEG